MAEIKWTLEAVKWLQDIHDYIAEDNANAAQNVITGIYEKVQVLKDFPQMGYLYRSEPEGENPDPVVWTLSNNIPNQRKGGC